ncbi:hypothetical protein BU15DRAFT_69374 [Melanogaster broomeanus]|nr:hypothetical protein BU15DRAFT_69374 [Melanogaster broomeanus]
MPSRTLSECPPYDVAPSPTQLHWLLAHRGDQRDRAFIIADVTFITAVPPEEVKIYTANVEKVGYYAGKVDTDNGILVQIEQYLVKVNRIVTQRPHPQALCPFLPQLDAFARHNRFNVLHPILRVLASRDAVLMTRLRSRRCGGKREPTTYGRSKLKKGSEKDVEEEVMEDIAVKHYD